MTKQIKTFILIGLLSILFNNFIQAQTAELPYTKKWTLVAGLTQPILLDGFNLAVNYTTNRWIFEYSHGFDLNYKSPALRADYQDIVLSVKSPYSTGPGIGYRVYAKAVTSLDIRAEAKVHQYDIQLNDTQEISYTNFDLGAGIYWQIRPFGKSKNALRGIIIEPSIRYWANVASSLEDNFLYTTNEGLETEHLPYPLDLFFNISIGYTFIN